VVRMRREEEKEEVITLTIKEEIRYEVIRDNF